MLSFKNLQMFVPVLTLALVVGCTDDKLTKLESCFDATKIASEEFVEILGSVNDEASAKAALPRLETTIKEMLSTAEALDDAAKTTLRSAAPLKKKIFDYRSEQKTQVDEHLKRIREIPEAVAVLEPVLTEYGLF